MKMSELENLQKIQNSVIVKANGSKIKPASTKEYDKNIASWKCPECKFYMYMDDERCL